MGDLTAVWRGLTLGSSSQGMGPYYVTAVTGWDDLVDVNDLSVPRARGDGDFAGEMYGAARIVTIDGTIADRANRDALIAALAAVTTVRSDLAPLTITSFGVTLTAPARVLRRSIPTKAGYGAGVVPFSVQLKCPSPLKFGPPVPFSTGLPTTGGGLTYPMTYPLSYGTPGNRGQVTVDNTGGTADAPLLLAIRGSLPQGWEVSVPATGERLTYPVAVPSGQTINVDTAAGTVLVENSSSRRGKLTHADWIQVPAGTKRTLQFTSLGGTYDAAAQLSGSMAEAHG